MEFSKKYTDAHNPQDGFAAILVCSEADTTCPKVAGASARIPVPYLDPKAFDGAPFEAAKYAERRDDDGPLHAQRPDAGPPPVGIGREVEVSPHGSRNRYAVYFFGSPFSAGRSFSETYSFHEPS